VADRWAAKQFCTLVTLWAKYLLRWTSAASWVKRWGRKLQFSDWGDNGCSELQFLQLNYSNGALPAPNFGFLKDNFLTVLRRQWCGCGYTVRTIWRRNEDCVTVTTDSASWSAGMSSRLDVVGADYSGTWWLPGRRATLTTCWHCLRATYSRRRLPWLCTAASRSCSSNRFIFVPTAHPHPSGR